MEDKQELVIMQLKSELYDTAKAYQEATGVIRSVILSLAKALDVDPNEYNLQQLLDMNSEAK